jgi:hypothetical protein
MTAPAAIKATFADFKLVRGRKVCQIILETPIEAADAALAALGGLPSSINERWVGVALLDPSIDVRPKIEQEPDTGTRGAMNVGLEHIEHEAAQKTKRRFADLPIAQRAALLCGREAFHKWLCEEMNYAVYTEDDATKALRNICGVSSRSALSSNAIAADNFEQVERDFNNWLNEP